MAGGWRHTIVVDGDLSDWWVADEGFETSQGTNYLTWDESYLYIGIQHPDTTKHQHNNWLFLHLGDGVEGSQAGTMWEMQAFVPPFAATKMLITEVGGGSDRLRSYEPPPIETVYDWLGTEGSVVAQQDANEALELAIPLSVVGATDRVELLLHLMDEAHPGAPGGLWCYASTPSQGTGDGDCRDSAFAAWLSFDLASPLSPVQQAGP